MKESLRIVQPNDKGYQGLTEITFPNGRTISCMGVGKEVEKAIRLRSSADVKD